MSDPSGHPPSSVRARAFRALASLDERHPWSVLLMALALAVSCVLYTRARLEFRTGQDDLVSADTRDSRIYLRYSREFPDLDGLIIAIRTQPSVSQAEQFADTLAKRLNRDPVNVKSVFYKIDPGLMGDRALLYLETRELAALSAKIRQASPFLRSYAEDPSLVTLFRTANRMTAAASRLTRHPAQDGSTTPSAAAGFALLDPILAGMLADPDQNPPSPWDALMPHQGSGGTLRNTYLSSANGKYLLMHVAPGAGAPNGTDRVQVIEDDLNWARAQLPEVQAGMTGGPALAYAEESTTRRDMMVGSIIAVVGLVLLLVIPFRGVVEPLFAIIALLIGVAWSFGFTTIAIGHLNLLSAVFTSVLAGIGINFPIHLMARYDEARRRGLAMADALELAVVNTGTGVFASACIMALAFLMPMFTDFRGIAELGEISAAGLFLCLISALLIFPALIALRDRKAPPRRPPRISLAPGRSILEKLFAYPGWIMIGAALATLAAAFLIRGVGFDQNVLKLQASDAEAVRYENILLRDSGRSSWFAVSFAGSRKGAARKAAAFARLPEVSDVETIENFIPADQNAKRAILDQISGELRGIDVHPLQRPSDPQALSHELTTFAARLDAIASRDRSSGAAKTAQMVHATLDRMQGAPHAFSPYEKDLAADLQSRLALLKSQLNPPRITEKNLPEILRDRFVSKSGLYLVQVYPKGDVWADAPLRRFVSALRTIDRDVTGPPVQTYTLANVMRKGYERAAFFALIAVFVFVFVDFRNLRDAILATVPLIFGSAWLLEAMGGLGWEFNLANLFAVPIIIGMGVDNGVNMLYRWREEQDKSSLILSKAVGKSVTICSLTTIAAFAALIPANHHGISSLGWVLTLGVSFILLATLIVLPALFELLGSRIENAHEHSASPRQFAGAHQDSEACSSPASADYPNPGGDVGMQASPKNS